MLYADEICIVSLSSSGLQHLLNICSDYCERHDLTFNSRKSMCMYSRWCTVKWAQDKRAQEKRARKKGHGKKGTGKMGTGKKGTSEKLGKIGTKGKIVFICKLHLLLFNEHLNYSMCIFVVVCYSNYLKYSCNCM